jgi:hypothetical protein
LTGTLRSARTSTRLPATSRSSSVRNRGMAFFSVSMRWAIYAAASPLCKPAGARYLHWRHGNRP